MTIRLARESDAGPVASLCGELGYPIPVEQARTRIMDDDEVVLLVADTAEGRVVGWIEVAPRRSVEFGEVAEIQGLVVTASERGPRRREPSAEGRRGLGAPAGDSTRIRVPLERHP